MGTLKSYTLPAPRVTRPVSTFGDFRANAQTRTEDRPLAIVQSSICVGARAVSGARTYTARNQPEGAPDCFNSSAA
jgi:hypothetical protein